MWYAYKLCTLYYSARDDIIYRPFISINCDCFFFSYRRYVRFVQTSGFDIIINYIYMRVLQKSTSTGTKYIIMMSVTAYCNIIYYAFILQNYTPHKLANAGNTHCTIMCILYNVYKSYLYTVCVYLIGTILSY